MVISSETISNQLKSFYLNLSKVVSTHPSLLNAVRPNAVAKTFKQVASGLKLEHTTKCNGHVRNKSAFNGAIHTLQIYTISHFQMTFLLALFAASMLLLDSFPSELLIAPICPS